MKYKIQDEEDFIVDIKRQIVKNNHADYLTGVLAEYDNYKIEFQKHFADTSIMSRNKKIIHSFHVEYILKEGVSRDIAILGSDAFLNLAKIIILSMGWVNDHMHSFGFTDRMMLTEQMLQLDKNGHMKEFSSFEFYAPGWEDDPYPTYKSDELRICDFNYKKTPELFFSFDFGDSHYFKITHKEVHKLGKYFDPSDFPLLEESKGIPPEQYPLLE